MKERKYLSKGWEHSVYLSNFNKQTVLKVPHLTTTLSLKTFFNGYKTIQKELELSHELIKSTNIKIPKTRIIPIKKSYVITQELIENDNSINIADSLANHPQLLSHYDSKPSNFASQNGIIYWLDPTKGPIGRLIEKTGFIDIKNYRRITIKIKKFKRAIRGN